MAPELPRVLTGQVGPAGGADGDAARIDVRFQRMVAGMLAARKAELAIEDPELAGFVLYSAIAAITHRAALFAPELLRDPRLIDEAGLRDGPVQPGVADG